MEMNFASSVITFAMLMIYSICNAHQDSQKSQILFEHLLNSSRYNPDVIPICGNGSNVTVKVGLAIRDIVELIEVEQIIRLKVWMRLKWVDCMLRWDPIKFDNQTIIVFPSENIWIPDITLFEAVSDEANMPGMDRFRAIVNYKGEVAYNFATIVTSVCRVVVTYFPFDHQVCRLTFGSWVYSGTKLDLERNGKVADIAIFQEHNEWFLEGSKLGKKVQYYSNRPDPYPDIYVDFYLRRKPVFYVVTLIFPCFIITGLTFMGFVLPPVSGEKISLQMTVLLSLTVFLFLVQDKLPSDSDHFPYLAIYFACSMLLVCLSSIMSGIVMHVYYKSPERHQMPRWVRNVFIDKLRKLVFVKSEKVLNTSEVIVKQIRCMRAIDEPTALKYAESHHARKDIQIHDPKTLESRITEKNGGTHRTPEEIAGKSQGNSLENIETDGQEDDVQSHDINDWELLAFILDRFFMVLYVTLNAITATTFLTIVISYDGGEKMDWSRIIFFVIFTIESFGQDIKPESLDLFEYLLDSSRYSPYVIPLCGNQTRVTVKIGTAIRDIVEMTETHQRARLNIWVRMTWTDCMLKWDPSSFQNQTEIILPFERIWIPDVTVFEGISNEANMPGLDQYRAVVSNNGEVRYNFPTIITSVCRVIVTYFPFDHQVCNLTFGSWAYSGTHLDWQSDGDGTDMSLFELHNEWDLVRTKSVRRVVYYLCCVDPYPDVLFHIHIRRKPVFYLVTIIFPSFLITSLALMGFVLPPVSGERIALQMTVLLSLSVFLVLLQEKLPSDSDNIPYLAMYFSISMLLVCVACIMSGIVLYVHYKSPLEKEMSSWVHGFFMERLRKIMRIAATEVLTTPEVISKQMRSMHAISEVAESQSELKRSKAGISVFSEEGILEILDVRDSKHDDKGHTSQKNIETPNVTKRMVSTDWELLAFILDRFFMWIYLMMNVVNGIVFLVTITSYNGDDQII
ncbi:uncharacterized protein LOC133204716 [Saccostrea echinata]|uniref:uncharacterized protein LOC133204716 n=1 Tax=Saccostrea echinata TaxID=191078 RepID=UPI002A7EC85E|nr:uncharacterized protein LOC133204716 [Saccostrea echinata]